MKKYLRLFLSMLKIGLFTFGGGYAMIALLENEFVEKKKYIGKEEFLDMVAIAESTPGPIAINSATFVGYRTCGVLGAACATLGVVLPSFIIILIVAKCYDRFRSSRIVTGCMSGLKPAVVGLIGGAANPVYYRKVMRYVELKYRKRYLWQLWKREKSGG